MRSALCGMDKQRAEFVLLYVVLMRRLEQTKRAYEMRTMKVQGDNYCQKWTMKKYAR